MIIKIKCHHANQRKKVVEIIKGDDMISDNDDVITPKVTKCAKTRISSPDLSTQTELSNNFISTVSVKYNQNDNDRVQLAQAINNLTVKGEQFIEAFNSFSNFRETLAQLDIQIETKKKNIKKHLKNKYFFNEKNTSLQKEYDEKTKELNTTYIDLNRDLQNDYKNKQIEYTQKLKRN